MMERVALSAGRCGSECVEYSITTITEFRLLRDIKVLDLCSITHSMPFYTNTNKVDYFVNERILSVI